MRQFYFLKASLLFFVLIYSDLFLSQTNYEALIVKKVSAIEQKVINWRHDFHQNPELGNREFRTAEIIAKHLQSLGMEVQTKVGLTGVVGILKGDKPGPVIALRADMDALPIKEKNDLPYKSTVISTYNGKETGVMHACGHDGHVAILMGVAEILSGMKKDLRGTVKFIFQPAEEGTPIGEEGGAKLMVKEGVLNNPKVDVIFGLHLGAGIEVGKITYRPAATMAGTGDFKITVIGKASHGASPWTSIDPIVVSSQIVNSLQTIVSRNVNIKENAAVVTVGAINGGNRFNIIPEKVEMVGTIRTFSDEDENLVFNRVRTIAEKTAEAVGATAIVELPYSMHYPVTFNNILLTNSMVPSLVKSVGLENVILVTPETGAEDFSYFAQEVPGLYFFIGGCAKGNDVNLAAPHHTAEFIIDDSSLKPGMTVFCNLVFDYLELHKKK